MGIKVLYEFAMQKSKKISTRKLNRLLIFLINFKKNVYKTM